MTDDDGAQDAVVIERSFDAPVELIWQMWTDPRHFRAWYGPEGATIPAAQMDVQVGGGRLVCMEVPTPTVRCRCGSPASTSRSSRTSGSCTPSSCPTRTGTWRRRPPAGGGPSGDHRGPRRARGCGWAHEDGADPRRGARRLSGCHRLGDGARQAHGPGRSRRSVVPIAAGHRGAGAGPRTGAGAAAMMGSVRTRGTAAAVLAVALVAACTDDRAGGSRADGEGMVAPATTAPTSPGPAGDWPTAGHDLANTRAVVGSAITADSWTTSTRCGGSSFPAPGRCPRCRSWSTASCTPRAARARSWPSTSTTARSVWAAEPTGFNIGPFGVAVDDERVYALDGSHGVVALDRGRRRRAVDGRRDPHADGRHRHPAHRRRRRRARELGARQHRRHLRPRRPRGHLRARRRHRRRAVDLRHRRGRPVGPPRGQLGRRRLVPAGGRRRPRPRLRRRRQPGAVPRHARVAERVQPARAQPVHELGGRPRPRHRRPALVPPGDAPRPLRPRPGARTAGRGRRRERRGGQRGQVRRPRRPRPRRRHGSLAAGGRRAPATTTCPPSTARPRWRRAPTAASSRRRRPPTASCTPPS